jgi:hypothetical protein
MMIRATKRGYPRGRKPAGLGIFGWGVWVWDAGTGFEPVTFRL